MSAQIFGDPQKRAYDMQISITIPDLPDPGNMMWLIWLSTSSDNLMGYANPEVDAAIQKNFTITNDQTERARLLTQAQAIVVPAQVQPPLVSNDIVLTLRSGLGGYQLASPQFSWDCQWIGLLSGN